MIGSLDNLDEVEEGALDRLREMKKGRVENEPFTKSVVGLILERVTGIAKARQRQFASRSEAGRYAAEMRWRNRQVKDENTIESLKQDVANLQAAIGAVSWGDCEAAEEAILDGKHIVRTPADWDANPDAYLVAMRTGTRSAPKP